MVSYGFLEVSLWFLSGFLWFLIGFVNIWKMNVWFLSAFANIHFSNVAVAIASCTLILRMLLWRLPRAH